MNKNKLFGLSGDLPDVYIDIDGTLAEWRNITFSANIKRPEDVEEAIKKLNDILLTPGYRSLLPYDNVVEATKILVNLGFNVHIASCAMNPDVPNGPAKEKREWIEKFLPWIPKENVHIIPNGANKAEYLGAKECSILIDDYTKNLLEWKEHGGIAIKLLNDVNEKKGVWRGDAVSYSYPPRAIAEGIVHVLMGKKVRHRSPAKTTDPYIEIELDER